MLSIELFSDVNHSFELKEMGGGLHCAFHTQESPQTLQEGTGYLIFDGKD